ncbi:MAG: diacylglycerol kinase [Betaproteobacteria bacterium]|nr:MAG: diacylglycerol kinase [Betaproteobacteria bacterium]
MLRSIFNAARNSLAGVAAAARNEGSFQVELAACAALLPLGLWLGGTGVERALLVSSVLIVLCAELVNTALEAAVDRISLEIHPLARRAKDIGSAAVMLALVNAGVVWLLVLFS